MKGVLICSACSRAYSWQRAWSFPPCWARAPGCESSILSSSQSKDLPDQPRPFFANECGGNERHYILGKDYYLCRDGHLFFEVTGARGRKLARRSPSSLSGTTASYVLKLRFKEWNLSHLSQPSMPLFSSRIQCEPGS